ncbi:beta strand repeat-containing protein [Arcticibacter sp. MXS-1]|uniref:beta strand repeat-containing protein n=1 Tax=Arcticibacter sp. MXS-1 TaxID=3341726 RepID=UPI0035A96073
MERLRAIAKILLFIVLAFTGSVRAQNYFRVVGGIPHLPLVDPSSIPLPETGMLVFSSVELKPMIYTGTGWETLCTNNFSSNTVDEFFVVKKGIPYLPALSTEPLGIPKAGAIYYNTTTKAVMIYSGSTWSKMVELINGTLQESSGFSTGVTVKTCKLPVLSTNPSPLGLSIGAFYINAVSKSIRYFDGAGWQDLTCKPVVKTLPVTGLTGYAALSGAHVLTNGGSPVTLAGICWSPSANPDTNSVFKTKNTTAGLGIGIFPDSLKGLLPKTTYHVRAYALNDQGIVYGDDVVFTTPIAPPTIITLAADSISSIRAVSGGDITADGGSPVTGRGIVWGAKGDPLTADSVVISDDGSGVGPFPSTLRGLLGNTTYYIRAYAVNAAGKAYGNLVVFTTPPPVVPKLNLALTVSNVTGSSATGTALLLNNGGAPVMEKGVCYSTDGINYTYVPSSTSTPGDFGTFITSLSGLSQGTTYLVKAYAKNSVGIGYSSETSFTTAALATIVTTKPSGLAGTTAQSGGTISNTGFSVITGRGICWSAGKNPTIDSAKTSEPIIGDGSGVFTSQMTKLVPGTIYYVRAYAMNIAGVAYGNLDSLIVPGLPKVVTSAASVFQGTTITGGNVLSDGGAPVTERGVCYSTSANPTIANTRTIDGTGTGWYTSLIPGLTPNVTYHIRAYAKNIVGVAYGDDLIHIVNPDAPVIITLDPANVTSMAAESGGNITSRGSAPITKRGIIYGTSGDPVNDPKAVVTNDGSGEGIFPTRVENLLANTTYYVRAYAENVYGLSYGEIKTFTTLPPILAAVMPPTFDITGITNTSAVGEFVVLNNGGDPITERGIRYSTDRVNYTYVASGTLNKTDIGTFIVNLTGLSPNTTYYAQSYAINSVGTAISGETSFRTTSLAVLSTTPPSNVTGFEAYSGGDITYTGDEVISQRGVCWSTTPNPTINSDKTSDPVSGIGLGSYTSHLTNLKPGQKYYIRAYAVNSYGIAYGNLDSLTTATTAYITTISATNVTSTSAVVGGYIKDDGREYVYTRGVCWSTSPNPTTAGNYIASGAGTGSFAVTLKDLAGSTKYYFRAFATNSVGTAYGNLDSLKTQTSVLASVVTTDIINIGGTTATGRGNIISNGGADVTERGFCWNTAGKPTVDGDHLASGNGSGSYSGGLTGLSPNTKYYVRAYAVNSVGVSYGNEISFSTYTIPTITTLPVYNVTSVDAKGGGDIISDGGATVTTSGICWNTTGNPTVNDLRTTSGVGIGQFIHTMKDLLGSTTYYVRAYAVNSAGTAYGNVESFTTAPPIIPSLTTTSGRSGVSGTTAIAGGTIISNGGAIITTEGLVWSTVSGFIPDTVKANRSVQSSAGNFTSTMTPLRRGTTYYARAYAQNSAGTGYAANEISFTTFDYPVINTIPPDLSTVTSVSVNAGGSILSDGGTTITESGMCWSTNSNPDITSDHISNGTGSGNFIRTITDLMGSTTYYVRAYAKNSVGIAYGNIESFTTLPPVLATVKTVSPEVTSSTEATSGGDITSNGGAFVTTRGVYWSTQQGFNPDTLTVKNRTAETGYFKGSYTARMSGLTPNTVYYVKAYAVNAVGVAYGEEMSFKTPRLPEVTTAYTTANGPTKATSGGDITDNGGATITARGVVFSTDPDFKADTVVLNRTVNGGGSGAFSSKLTGLKGNTTYYVRAYATNIAGTAYGNLLSFITDPATLATLTTRDPWNVYGLTATSGGVITDNGGEPVTTRGVVWSTTKGFRPDTVSANKTIQTGSGIGSFASGITGLKRGTTYYVRAYAINSIGTAYASNEISFTTLDFPTLTTMAASPSSTGYSATSGGTLIGDGGTDITNIGVCWSTSPNPTVGLHTKTIYDSWSGKNWYSELKDLTPVTKYYVRAYAVNNQGVAYGNEVEFTTPPALATVTTSYATPVSKSSVVTGGEVVKDGGAAITERGVIWSTDANFNPDTVTTNKTVDGVGTGKFSSTINGMRLSTSYYIRAYAVNSAGTAYGNQVTVTIFPTAPILNTIELSQLTGVSAMSGGEIISDGGADVTLKGICWATHTNPTVADSRTTNGSGTASYIAMLTGLQPNTLYYVRAYAVNKIGTAYGIERTFQTNGIPTLTATRPVTDIVATTATSGER